MKAFRNFLYATLAFIAILVFHFGYFALLIVWRTFWECIKVISNLLDIINDSYRDASKQSTRELETYWRAIKEGKL